MADKEYSGKKKAITCAPFHDFWYEASMLDHNNSPRMEYKDIGPTE